MTREEAIKELESLQRSDDQEAAHIQADDVLITFLSFNGFEDVALAYVKLRHELGFWYA